MLETIAAARPDFAESAHYAIAVCANQTRAGAMSPLTRSPRVTADNTS